ncbi:MAG: hypothetical protein K2Q13_04980 [Nitrosomonas sp.]|uniref:hypothetical protein n=1 Tax=Nitrosomonas sp. TaxID=42353 RepID=UPI0025E29A72|nr:hypothetical protein [Nitrosomonas sp.]MBY0474405.1 hypothetical protein [Nitrosomonas sp.]
MRRFKSMGFRLNDNCAFMLLYAIAIYPVLVAIQYQRTTIKPVSHKACFAG